MIRRDMPGDEFQLDVRLIEVGESVAFTLRGATTDDRLEIFPRYLERCDPEHARQSQAPLQWLDDLERGETAHRRRRHGHGSAAGRAVPSGLWLRRLSVACVAMASNAISVPVSAGGIQLIRATAGWPEAS